MTEEHPSVMHPSKNYVKNQIFGCDALLVLDDSQHEEPRVLARHGELFVLDDLQHEEPRVLGRHGVLLVLGDLQSEPPLDVEDQQHELSLHVVKPAVQARRWRLTAWYWRFLARRASGSCDAHDRFPRLVGSKSLFSGGSEGFIMRLFVM